MKFQRLLIAGALVAAGCASAGRGTEPDPGARLALGLAALERYDFAGAQEHFAWLREHHPDQPAGQQAQLLLVAIEIDPANAGRRLSTSADAASALRRSETLPPYMRWVSSTFSRLAHELVAIEEREAREREALGKPNEQLLSHAAEIRRLTQERHEAMVRVDTLDAKITLMAKDLKEKTTELERLRKIVKE
jgi:hypothetical protein